MGKFDRDSQPIYIYMYMYICGVSPQILFIDTLNKWRAKVTCRCLYRMASSSGIHLRPASNTKFVGPQESRPINRTSFCSAVFAQRSRMAN